MVDVSQDKTRARLRVDAELTAQELQDLICELAMARSRMLPAVPTGRSEVIQEDRPMTCQDDPAFEVTFLHDSQIRLSFFHAGFGWMLFNLGFDNAWALRDGLNRFLPPAISREDLLLQSFPEGEHTH